ncbi:hypothetical protein LTR36_008819 [Oleoguttula mirabilis]|uniref:Uncharacterized protein n=1 Tax=Oleoguttula mirabilis TaxID=1507867 RepID=A0AAV9J791_9PEZI|nr:hypothetical protein LTR36_008819 [Oleoguttula mirabilis]
MVGIKAPSHTSKPGLVASAKRAIPKLVKRGSASTTDSNKRKQDDVGESGTKQRKQEPDVIDRSGAKKRKTGPVVARADSHQEEDPAETAESEPEAPTAHSNPIDLPQLSCTLDGDVEVSPDPTLFRLQLKAATEHGDREGFCLIPADIFKPKQQEAIRSRKFAGLHREQLQCHAHVVRIDEEAEEDYVLAIKVTHVGMEFDGGLRIPTLEIGRELLEEWLARRDEPLMESIEEGPDPVVEEANKYNRTVHIIGNLAIGERRGTAVKVEVWSWDGLTSLEVAAKIIESTKRGEGYRLRLRVKLAEKAFLYLSGWVHADMKGGRFAEELPGELFTK